MRTVPVALKISTHPWVISSLRMRIFSGELHNKRLPFTGDTSDVAKGVEFGVIAAPPVGLDSDKNYCWISSLRCLT